MEELDIEKLLNENAANYKQDAPAESWTAIRDALHPQKKRRPILLLLPILLTTFGIGYWLGDRNNNTAICAMPTTVKNGKVINNTNANTTTTVVTATKSNQAENQLETTTNNDRAINETNELSENTATELRKDNTIKDKYYTNKEQRNAEVSTYKSTIDEPLKTEETKLQEKLETKLEETNTTSLPTTESKAVIEENKQKTKLTTLENSIDKTNTVSVKNEKQRIKKWKSKVTIGTSLFTISNQNVYQLFTNNNKSNNRSANIVAQTTATPSNGVQPKPIYTNASLQQVQYIMEKQNKKTAIQLGVQLQYGSFNTQGYTAPLPNFLAANIQTLDNSGYTTLNNLRIPVANKPIYLTNKFLHLGAVVGVNKNILDFHKKKIVGIHYQLVPSYTVQQSVYWFEPNTARLWRDKKQNNSFVLYNNIGVDIDVNVKKWNFQVGPVYSFTAFSQLNKKSATISDMHINAVGLRMAMLLK